MVLDPSRQDKRFGATRVEPNADGSFLSKHPDGDKPVGEAAHAALRATHDGSGSSSTGGSLTVLKREDFSTGTFADMPWVSHNRGNFDYSALRDYGGGERSIRHLLNGDYSTDPITGQLCNGLYSHTFLADDFYDPAVNGSITFEQYFKLDDSFWDTNADDPYPLIAGKLFLSDSDIDSEGPYLGLTDGGTIPIVAQNGPSSWSDWTSRSYGWKDSQGAARNNIYLTTPTPLFQSDGVTRRLTFEIQYDPGGIGYHKGRMRVDGQIMHDSAGINTDANGWFNLPIEYHLKGTRIYAAGLDINTFADASTDPATYDGYAGGYEVSEYTIYEGVIS